MTETTVAVILVTFNKLDLLKQALKALRDSDLKPHYVVVVDNASTDGTREWLAKQPDIITRSLDRNLGGAGGFHAGIISALQTGADWLWLMDDDCCVTPDSLEKLLLATKRRPGFSFYASQVLWTDKRPCRMNIPQPIWEWTDYLSEQPTCVPIAACSFVSCLIPSALVKTVGLPIAEFFIWYDDFEYTGRLSRYSPGLHVANSIVHHHTPFNGGVDWRGVNTSNLWKYKYGIRNEIALTMRKRTLPNVLRGLLRIHEVSQSLAKSGASRKIRRAILWSGLGGAFVPCRKYIAQDLKTHFKLEQRLLFKNRLRNTPLAQVCHPQAGGHYSFYSSAHAINSTNNPAPGIAFSIPPSSTQRRFAVCILPAHQRRESINCYCALFSGFSLANAAEYQLAHDAGFRELQLTIPPDSRQQTIVLSASHPESLTEGMPLNVRWIAPRLLKQASAYPYEARHFDTAASTQRIDS